MKAATRAAKPAFKFLAISIHAAREGGDPAECFLLYLNYISIHAAREGGDSIALSPTELEGISIHAAREGGDSMPNGRT